jgi:hypothetical protein
VLDLSDPSGPAIKRGFIRLLAAHLLSALSQDWLDASGASAEQIGQDVARRTDDAARSQHHRVGYELLRPFSCIDATLKRNDWEIGAISAILNS